MWQFRSNPPKRNGCFFKFSDGHCTDRYIFWREASSTPMQCWVSFSDKATNHTKSHVHASYILILHSRCSQTYPHVHWIHTLRRVLQNLCDIWLSEATHSDKGLCLGDYRQCSNPCHKCLGYVFRSPRHIGSKHILARIFNAHFFCPWVLAYFFAPGVARPCALPDVTEVAAFCFNIVQSNT